MDINFDDLKKEFDDFKIGCESECEEEESLEEEGFIETVSKLILIPLNCGVYFSRLDIKIMGLEFDEDVQIRERRRMLRDILKSITSKEALEDFFNIIKRHTDSKVKVYEELIENFPASKEIFEKKIEKANNLKKRLDRILNDFEGVEDLTF